MTFVTIPARNNIPSTDIFVKIIKKDNTQNFIWPREVMILIHGGPGGNHTLYSDIESDLLEMADLILIDLRGCGLSTKIDVQHCTLNNHIDDLQLILQALKISDPIIHGCSYGAIVTLGFSIFYPDTPKKIILSSCAVSGDFIGEAKENLKRLGTVQQIMAAEKLWNGTFENAEQFIAYYNIMTSLYIFNMKTNHTLPATSQNISYNIELVNFAFTTFLKTFNFRDELSKIKALTLIFSGKNDWIFDHKHAETLHSEIKHSLLISLDNCGHFPWKDQREIFLSIIKNFIETNLEEQNQILSSYSYT